MMSRQWPDRHQFWRNRRVAVTGGNGLLGKNVVCKLEELGADVCVIDIESMTSGA
jgi:nucleoside-diphosphate-sugar epimerase